MLKTDSNYNVFGEGVFALSINVKATLFMALIKSVTISKY